MMQESEGDRFVLLRTGAASRPFASTWLTGRTNRQVVDVQVGVTKKMLEEPSSCFCFSFFGTSQDRSSFAQTMTRENNEFLQLVRRIERHEERFANYLLVQYTKTPSESTT